MGDFWYSYKLLLSSILISVIFSLEQAIAQDAEVENLGGLVNSSYHEENLVISPDGKTIYFTREDHPENIGSKKGDIWYSTLDNEGRWTAANHLGQPINNSARNAVAGFSPDGDIMYLHHHYSRSGKPKTQGISFSRKNGNGWSYPEKAAIPYFYNKSDHLSLSVSHDGKIMLIAMESYGSFGAEDLYVSFLENEEWTEPANLGNAINTKFQEMTPYLAADNATLYFASNGYDGLGSRDIYMSQRLDDAWTNWSKPVNLGRPVNSEGVELSYVISPIENYAYFISTQNSDGYGDISRIEINPEDKPEAIAEVDLTAKDFTEPDTIIVIPQSIENETAFTEPSETLEEEKAESLIQIKGVVLNKKDNQPIKALLVFEDKITGLEVKELHTDSEGIYTVSLPANEYIVHISASGYLNDEQEFSVEEVAGPLLNNNYYLSSLDVGSTIQLNNVLFKRGTANMLAGSEQDLDRVAKMLNENPGMEIEISGHTDNRGDFKLNIKLSQERVETVVDYLVNKGIDRNRLQGKGYGGSKPIASNKSEQTRKLNRRVEFTVLQNNEEE